MVKENIYRSKRVNDRENEHENDDSFYSGRVFISFTTMTSFLLSFFFKNTLIVFNCYFLKVDFLEGAFIANVSLREQF